MKSNTKGSSRNPRLPFRVAVGRIRKPSMAIAHHPGEISPPERAAARVRDVVVTVTVKVDAEVALTLTVAGGEQLAPRGAPVQLNEAVPLTPTPPIARV
jgi:hypothetical protein